MALQEGLESSRLQDNYYDIMLVGMTGQGKSTTADKLLIANPEGKEYSVPEKTQPHPQPSAAGTEQIEVKLEDMSMWLLHEEDSRDEVETYLKGLLYCRASTPDPPHTKVNTMRDPKKAVFKEGTAACQVFSNDTTKIRVLDVPGFNDGKAFKSPTTTSSHESSAVYQTAKDVTTFNLGITRNIIRIQTALGMHFRRIVYFLPSRGPLERAHSLLKTELQSLETAYGMSIFKCMVAVATVPRRYSLKDESDEEKFPEEDVEQCQKYFQESLREVLSLKPTESEPKVPIIFISLSETCESILCKIKTAEVVNDSGLSVSFNPSTCANCGLKINSLDGVRVSCSFPHDQQSSILYEESTCHPAFRHSILRKVLGRRISRAIANRWPSYKEEYCIECDQRPFQPGCKRVNEECKTRSDHTSEVSEPVTQPERDNSNRPHQETAKQNATPTGGDVRADQLVVEAGRMQISDT